MDDGTGRVNPTLVPLLAALTAMDRPKTGLAWLRNPQVPRLLADLATGRIPLTHAALHPLATWRTVAYLRDLLMACGVLPAVDKQPLHFEAWLHQRLTQLADHPDVRLLRQSGTPWSRYAPPATTAGDHRPGRAGGLSSSGRKTASYWAASNRNGPRSANGSKSVAGS